MSKIEFPEGVRVSPKMVEAQIEDTRKRLEMGFVGKLFGHGQEKLGNVVIFSILLACAMIVFVSLVPVSDTNFPRREMLLSLVGIIPAALGFLFGNISGRKAD